MSGSCTASSPSGTPPWAIAISPAMRFSPFDRTRCSSTRPVEAVTNFPSPVSGRPSSTPDSASFRSGFVMSARPLTLAARSVRAWPFASIRFDLAVSSTVGPANGPVSSAAIASAPFNCGSSACSAFASAVRRAAISLPESSADPAAVSPPKSALRSETVILLPGATANRPDIRASCVEKPAREEGRYFAPTRRSIVPSTLGPSSAMATPPFATRASLSSVMCVISMRSPAIAPFAAP